MPAGEVEEEWASSSIQTAIPKMGNCFFRSKEMPDPHTGMVAKEKNAVRISWSYFHEHYADNGVSLFIELFTRYPEYKLLFPEFENEATPSLSKNPRLAAHGIAVIYQISALVDSLDDTLLLVELLRKNAYSHYNRRGVTAKHFFTLTQVMKHFLQTKLGPAMMNNEANSGWDKIFLLMVQMTKLVYDDLDREAHHWQRRHSVRSSSSSPSEKTSPRSLRSVVKNDVTAHRVKHH